MFTNQEAENREERDLDDDLSEYSSESSSASPRDAEAGSCCDTPTPFFGAEHFTLASSPPPNTRRQSAPDTAASHSGAKWQRMMSFGANVKEKLAKTSQAVKHGVSEASGKIAVKAALVKESINQAYEQQIHKQLASLEESHRKQTISEKRDSVEQTPFGKKSSSNVQVNVRQSVAAPTSASNLSVKSLLASAPPRPPACVSQQETKLKHLPTVYTFSKPNSPADGPKLRTAERPLFTITFFETVHSLTPYKTEVKRKHSLHSTKEESAKKAGEIKHETESVRESPTQPVAPAKAPRPVKPRAVKPPLAKGQAPPPGPVPPPPRGVPPVPPPGAALVRVRKPVPPKGVAPAKPSDSPPTAVGSKRPVSRASDGQALPEPERSTRNMSVVKIPSPIPRPPEVFQSVFSPKFPRVVKPAAMLDHVSLYRAEGLESQYFFLANAVHKDTFNAAKMSANMSKNRYGDIPCYDATRVKLTSGDSDSTNYINANFVSGYRNSKAYICCQGPLERTCNDFWHMIWQENVRVIVMTTRTKEKGRVKCASYWPEAEHEAHQYRGYFVVNTKIKSAEKYIVTSLILRCEKSEKIRLVYHLLFLAWPDYGVPAGPEDLLELINKSRQLQVKGSKLAEKEDNWAGHPEGPPLVIHCSAGVGRSGTFMCVDIGMRMLDDIQKVQIEEIVKALRSQRAFAVQTAKQYVFCHVALLQYSINIGLLPAETKLPSLLKD